MIKPSLIEILHGGQANVTPVWLMRQAGRYLPEYRKIRERAGTFLDLVYNPDLAAEVTLQPLKRFPLSAAILFSDILVVPDALGQQVGFQAGEGPVLEPIRTVDGLKKLSRARVEDVLNPVYETVRRVRAALPDGKALIGFAGAPWTVATYMVEGRGSKDQGEAKKWAYADPDGFSALIDLLVETTADYLNKQAAAGADVLQIFDSWAGSLPENEFSKWSIRPTAEIVRRVRDKNPHIPIIGFPRGAGPLYADYARETSVDALSLDTALPQSWAAQHLQDHWILQGNLDPKFIVAGGKRMLEEAGRILKAFSGGPHIFNTGHGLTPETPPDHVAELIDFVVEWKHENTS